MSDIEIIFLLQGCIGEVRIGGLLLPYFTPKELKQQNDTTSYKRDYFELNDSSSKTSVALNCSLCFQEDCKNDGKYVHLLVHELNLTEYDIFMTTPFFTDV